MIGDDVRRLTDSSHASSGRRLCIGTRLRLEWQESGHVGSAVASDGEEFENVDGEILIIKRIFTD